MKKIKIAVVHDDFIQLGGAEFLTFDTLKLLKNNGYEITVFSSIFSQFWKKKILKLGIEFEESFLGKLPLVDKISKLFFYTNLFYLAFESFDFSDYDIVLSFSTRYAHCIITKPSSLHISYLHSPSKVLWEIKKYFFNQKFLYFISKNFLPNKRIIDFYSQQRSDLVVANSKNISSKILKLYSRKSEVIYPFVKKRILTENTKKEDFFVLISRIIPWKRIDYVIESFNQMDAKLVIIGRGDRKYLNYLKKISKPNINFVGYVSENEKFEILRKAHALIVPQDEDFGLVTVESLTLGTPVVYFNKGGTREIIDSRFGVPVADQLPDLLTKAIKDFKNINFNSEEIKNYSLKFSEETFFKQIDALIKSAKM